MKPPPEEIPTVPMIGLAELLALANLGLRMRNAQKAYFKKRNPKLQQYAEEELLAAKRVEASFDAAVKEVLARPRQPALPGMGESG